MPEHAGITPPAGPPDVMQILVIDDHPLTCAGLKLLLETSCPDTQAAGVNGAVAARRWLLAHGAPDWIFLDLRLPDDIDSTLLSWLRAQGLAGRVILMSAESAEAPVRRAMAAGARGFIPKAAPPEQVLQDFAAIRAGEIVLPERFDTTAAAEQPAPAAFSPRKAEVYRLLLKGQSNKGIARTLGLSENTVKEYVSSILAARGVNSRMDLVLQDGAGGSTAA